MTKAIYDEDIDSLFLSNKKKTEKVKGSAVVGDFVIDFTTKEKIVGIEIRKVSDFLKPVGITKEMLSEIESSQLKVNDKNPSRIVMWIELKIPKIKEPIKVPVTLPLSQGQRAEAAIA